MTTKLQIRQPIVRDLTAHGKTAFLWRVPSAMATAILLAAVATIATTRSAHAGGCWPTDRISLLCSGTTNETDSTVVVGLEWCGNSDTANADPPSLSNGPCNDVTQNYTFLNKSEATPPREDWDTFLVPIGCTFRGTRDYNVIFSSNFEVVGGSQGTWVRVHNDEHYFIKSYQCVDRDYSPPDEPPESDGAGADPPVSSPQQSLPRRKSGIYAVGAGVDNASVDLLGARPNTSGFRAITNGLHAPGYGWGGMKVVAGDFNGDGRIDIGAIGAGVDGHSVDLLVALANSSGGYAPIANWLHADGYGWGGMKVVAGDFNGDGRWDIGAIGAGVNGTSVDLLVATSTGSGFHPFANWRHAEGFGWNGMKPVAGDFNGDGRWDIGAIGAGVNNTSVDLLVATSTGSGFNPIANWRHAEGFGWNGMKPVAGDFDGDGRWDIGAIGDGVQPGTIDLLVALSTSNGFGPIGNWLHAIGYGWGGMSPSSL